MPAEKLAKVRDILLGDDEPGAIDAAKALGQSGAPERHRAARRPAERRGAAVAARGRGRGAGARARRSARDRRARALRGQPLAGPRGAAPSRRSPPSRTTRRAGAADRRARRRAPDVRAAAADALAARKEHEGGAAAARARQAQRRGRRARARRCWRRPSSCRSSPSSRAASTTTSSPSALGEYIKRDDVADPLRVDVVRTIGQLSGAAATTALVEYIASVPAKDDRAVEEGSAEARRREGDGQVMGAGVSRGRRRRSTLGRSRSRSSRLRDQRVPARRQLGRRRVGARRDARRDGHGRPENAAGRPLAFLALGGAQGPAARGLRSRRVARPVDAAGRDIKSRVAVGADSPRLRAAADAARRARRRRRAPSAGATPSQGRAPARLHGRRQDASTSSVQEGGQHLHGGRPRCARSRPRRARRAGGTSCRRETWARPRRAAASSPCPLRSQYVTLLDASDGEQLAQVLSNEEAATFVRALPEGLFFGSAGVFRLAPRHGGGLAQVAPAT